MLVQLLEAIGAISKSTRKKAEGKLAAYQDAVTAPIAREDDDDADLDEEDEDDEEYNSEVRSGRGVQKFRSVEKVSFSFPPPNTTPLTNS